MPEGQPSHAEQEPHLEASRAAFMQAVDAVEAYEKTQGWGHVLAGAILKTMGESTAELESNLEADRLYASWTIDDVRRSLTDIGVAPVTRPRENPKREEGNPQGFRIREDVVTLLLRDSARLTQFLRSLGDSGRVDEPFRAALQTCCEGFVRQLDSPKEEHGDVIVPYRDGGVELAAELAKHFPENVVVEAIADYSTASSVGKEDVIRRMRTASIFDRPETQSFGPWRWHTNTDKRPYEEKWTTVIRIMDEAIEDCQNIMRPIVQRALENLRDALKAAVKFYESLVTGDNEHSRTWATPLLAIAERYQMEIRTRLESFTSTP